MPDARKGTEAVVSASAVTNAGPGDAAGWFLELEEHPERYRFESHEGFEMVSGSFGEVGSRFRTVERFLFLRLEQLFELTSAGPGGFGFSLLRPLGRLRIEGRFSLVPAGGERTRISLEIGARTRAGRLLLRLPPVRAAVRRQVSAEVEHVARSIEHT